MILTKKLYNMERQNKNKIRKIKTKILTNQIQIHGSHFLPVACSQVNLICSVNIL